METNLIKLASKLQDNPELQEKISAEARRLADSGEAADPKEALTAAIRSLPGLDLTEDELNTLADDSRELAREELEAVSSGIDQNGNVVQGMPTFFPKPEIVDDLIDTVKGRWDKLVSRP